MWLVHFFKYTVSKFFNYFDLKLASLITFRLYWKKYIERYHWMVLAAVRFYKRAIFKRAKKNFYEKCWKIWILWSRKFYHQDFYDQENFIKNFLIKKILSRILWSRKFYQEFYDQENFIIKNFISFSRDKLFSRAKPFNYLTETAAVANLLAYDQA